jgi:hypothetical protein
MPTMSEAGRPRVIVCGTRTFDQRAFIEEKMDRLVMKLDGPIICTGAAAGADKLAEDWALSRGLLLKRFHPDWGKHGKKAGPIRNREMCEYAAERKPAFLVAFHDGVSKGTLDCIVTARKLGIKVRIIKV